MVGKDCQDDLLASKKHWPTAFEHQLDALVADWVGEEATPGVLGKFHRQPQKIGGAVDRFLGKIHQDDAILLERVVESWKEIVGEQTSKQLVPVEIKENKLVISAMNQTYLFVYQQPQMKAMLMQRLSELTDGRICDFRIVSQGRR